MGEPNREGDVKVPLAEWVEAIVDRTARRVIEQHSKQCPIGNVVKDLYGDGMEDQGIKGMVAKAQGGGTVALKVIALLAFLIGIALAVVQIAQAVKH